MKFYIASRVKNKELVKNIHQKLISSGHTVLSTWVDEKSANPYENHVLEAKNLAIQCVNAVKECDVFILISDETGSGMYTEMGVALSRSTKNKPKIYVIGDYINRSAFFFHPSVKRLSSFNDVLKDLEIKI